MSDRPAYLRPYQEAVEAFGPRFEALLWNRPETQRVRFEALVSMLELEGRTLADLGCGRADLAAFLRDRGIAYGRYLGVEGVHELCEACRVWARVEGLRDCVFHERDFVADERVFGHLVRDGGASVLVFSGSLNTLDPAHARRVLDRAWDAVRAVPGGTLAFNFLSDRHGDPTRTDEDTGPARRFDTLALLDWAMRSTPRVRFRQDYLQGHDAAIVMIAP
ncbi:MAG: hypothetical protein ACIARR_04310 [Phycisphaerales bacterium JB059]